MIWQCSPAELSFFFKKNKKFDQIFVLLGFKFQSDSIYRRAVAEPAIIDQFTICF
jgi:hypothetical protein